MFVSVRSSNGVARGLAKLIGRVGDCVSVEFFDAPTLPLGVETVNLTLVDQVTLPEQTRLYHFDERLQGWRIGRLMDDHGDSHSSSSPMAKAPSFRRRMCLYAAGAPVADSTPFIAATITETPRFADARSAFVRSVVAQRGASMSMSALLSSAIEGNELKVVVPQPDLDLDALGNLRFGRFSVQPMDGPGANTNIRHAVEICMRRPQWQLSLQTHKLLGIR